MGTAFFKKMFPKESPIKLLIEHAIILEDVTKKVKILVEKYFNDEDISELVEDISRQESKADDLKFEIRKILAESVRTPFAIKDILDYLNYQETLVDYMEDIAKKLSLNKIEGLDEEVKSDFLELVQEVVNSIDFLENMVSEMKKIIDASFATKFLKEEQEESLRIEAIEGNVDKISLRIGKWIYSKKKEMNPIDLIFFRELVLIFVKVTDIAENTAELLSAFVK